MAKDNPHPTDIKLHKPSKTLTIKFDDDAEFEMSCEYLRVHSPSAEVQGHGPGEGVLQVDKEGVGIERIEQVVFQISVRFHIPAKLLEKYFVPKGEHPAQGLLVKAWNFTPTHQNFTHV